jgi:uncharacterized protein (TIGR00290 family)
MYNAVVSWSGGKDSCYALYKASIHAIRPVVLLNVLNEAGKISRSHGIPESILNAQSLMLGIPLHTIAASWQEYEQYFTGALTQLKQTYHLTHAVFGDIDLQGHRDWEEKVCATAELQAHLPLWHESRKALVLEMLAWGIKTIIVSCNETMGAAYLGREITSELIEELEKKGIDPCGENGEFHTLVIDCPMFSKGLQVTFEGSIFHEGYWFTEIKMIP